jgi:hypothetical protein
MIIERIRRPIESGMCITEGSTPVIYFGDYDSAKACTIALNPSDKEFLVNGGMLTGKAERLCSRRTLGKNNGDLLTEEDAKKVLDYCKNYFSRNPFRDFFDPFNHFVKLFGNYSYYDGTCVHLDLVQWATTPKWGDIPSEIRDKHLEKDLSILEHLLNNNKFEVIFLNGSTVVSTIRDNLKGMNVNEKRAKFKNTKGKETNMTVYTGDYNNIKIIGWSLFLQNPPVGGDYKNIDLLYDTIKDKIKM